MGQGNLIIVWRFFASEWNQGQMHEASGHSAAVKVLIFYTDANIAFNFILQHKYVEHLVYIEKVVVCKK